jgi:hypothetical protein
MVLALWSVAWMVALLLRHPLSWAERARVFGVNAGAALLGGVMSALTWLPFLFNTSESARVQPLSVDSALSAAFSLPAKDLWGMLWSFNVQHPLPGSELDMSLRGTYFGAIGLVLAAVCLTRAHGWIVAPLLTLSLGSLLLSLGGWFFGRVFLHILLPVLNFSRLPAADSRGLAILGLSVLAGGGATLLAQRDPASGKVARKAVVGLFVFYLFSLVGLPLIYGKPIEAVLSTVTFEVLCMALALLALGRASGPRLAVLLAGIVWLENGYCALQNFEPIGQPISKNEYLALTKHVPSFTLEGVNGPRLGDGANPVDQSSAEGFMAKKFHINDYNPLRLSRFQSLIDAGFLPWMQTGPRVAGLPPGAQPRDFAQFNAQVTSVPFSIVEYLPNRVRYRVEPGKAARLVFNELYFPGWQATIDGAAAPVEPLAGGLRSLEVKGGNHDLLFTFRPRLYFVALTIALAGFVTLISWLVVLLVRRHKRSQTSGAEAPPLFEGPRASET